MLASLSTEGIIKIWLGNEIKEVIRLYDEDIKSDLGVEDVEFLVPKNMTYNDGVFVVGLENNMILKVSPDLNKVAFELLIINRERY